MKPETRKNISPVLHDIRHPVRRGMVPRRREKADSKNIFSLIGAIAIVLVFAVFVSSFGISVPDIRTSFLSVFDSDRESADSARASSEAAISGLLANLGELVGSVRELRDGFSILMQDGVELVLNGRGDEFISVLKSIHGSLSNLDSLGLNMSGFGGLSPAFGDVEILHDGLGAVINFLDVPEKRRIALLFQNHSEIRPTGGFIGSYAEVVLDRGAIESIEVKDIYYPDRRLSEKIIPPTELQSITGGWGARDANWFLDFPTSAEKVLELLEASDIYVPDGIKFDGAIAVNAYVVEDFLRVTGPIEVPEYGVVLTADNFLFEVREEVEESRDDDPTKNPKQILGAMMPVLFERLEDASQSDKRALAMSLISRVASKDIQAYFRDPDLEKFVHKLGASGSVYRLPRDFSGDYLAVVNANVAGGKSDIFIEQSIELDSIIDEHGMVMNDLTVVRSHFGENQAEPLYRARNQNFIRVYAVEDALLKSISGITPKTINPLVNYESSEYRIDPLLYDFESTREVFESLGAEARVESGKRVFAGWFSTDTGDTSTLNLRYTGTAIPLESGAKFRFIFEKQSGVDSKFRYKITAPSGFYFLESGTGEFALESNSQPRRIVIELTLIQE